MQIAGTFGFGGFGPTGGMGFSPYGGLGFSPYGFGNGYAPFGGFGYGGFGNGGFGNGGFGFGGFGNGGFGYGPFNFGQQLFQQQASLTQQIYQQRQLMLIDQIRQAQGRVDDLDTAKQQLFREYLAKNDTDRAAVRSGLIREYLRLNPPGREAWKRDAVVQIIFGQDLSRLDGVAEFRTLAEPDRAEFRQAMLEKYQSLAIADRQVWQQDQIIGEIMGRDWWPR